jgi:hypothetical protein
MRAVNLISLGPIRESVYFSRGEMHEAMSYEEHREALIKSVPSHFGGYAEQWRLILKRKDKW